MKTMLGLALGFCFGALLFSSNEPARERALAYACGYVRASATLLHKFGDNSLPNTSSKRCDDEHANAYKFGFEQP